MSLIARFAPVTTRTAAVASRATTTTAPIYARTAVAPFSTTSAQRKGAVDTAKEKLKKVDKTISGAAVKGIEKGEHATEKIRNTVGYKSKQAEEKAKKAAEKGEFTSDTKGFEG